MAQVLKDEIRDAILSAALQEFYAKGYKAAAMRSIAQTASIPTGLIYSYFKNKEELFYAVLRPVLYDWQRVLETGKDTHNHKGGFGLSRAETECLLNLFEHRQQCILLMDKSGGTKYEHEKDRLIKTIEAHLNKHQKDKNADVVFTHIIANNFVDGLMQIMYHYKNKEWALLLLNKLSKMYLAGIGF